MTDNGIAMRLRNGEADSNCSISADIARVIRKNSPPILRNFLLLTIAVLDDPKDR
jgi:hypothetical protein